MKQSRSNYITLVLIGLWVVCVQPPRPAPAAEGAEDSLSRHIRQPDQITSESDPVTAVAVSLDGKNIIYAVEREGFNDLWMTSADPAVLTFPRRLTDDPSLKSSPAFSPDGRFIAYRGNAHDVKGDIYLLNIEGEGAKPRRLTDRDSEDDGPCFSADGRTLFFHQISEQFPLGTLVALPVEDTGPGNLTRLPTGGDASFPAVSPEGQKICFVSHRHDPGGDLFVLELQSGRVSQVTSGPALDFSPTWSMAGRGLFFIRLDTDTNQDHRVDSRDRGVIQVFTENRPPGPMTPLNESVLQVRTGGGNLYYLSDRSGVVNCWRLPETGLFLPAGSGWEQLSLADRISAAAAFTPHFSLPAYQAVLQHFLEDRASCAQALNHMGDMYRKLAYPEQALAAYDRTRTDYAELQPAAALAEIAAVMTRCEMSLAGTADGEERLGLTKTALEDLSRINGNKVEAVKARLNISAARILSTAGVGTDELLKGMRLLDQVLENRGATRSERAEALTLKADMLRQSGLVENARPLYSAVVRDYSDQPEWAKTAVDKILDLVLGEMAGADITEKILTLRRVAEDNQAAVPLLTLGALTRMGDLYFADDQWERAKELYGEAVRRFPAPGIQTGAARLALAEILYREERFRQALDLYGKTIELNPAEEHIRRLARQGYIRKSVASGEFLFRLGELAAAQKVFKELMDFDDSIVEAHRGYIKCAAALNRLGERLETYRKRLDRNPDDPMAVYGTALCLTYEDDGASMGRARDLLVKAVRLNGQVEYFHQTLGFTLETLETVYGQKGLLEAALSSYYKAYYLNDQNVNPDNRSHLLLNLGNIHYLLGQYRQAFHKYRLRLERKTAFDHLDTEILFHKRMAESAFQNRENKAALAAYSQALALTDGAIDPRAALQSLEAVHRWSMDNLLVPAAADQGLKETVKPLLAEQTDIQLGLGRLAQDVVSPAQPGWPEYKDKLRAQLSAQKELLPQLLALSRQWNNPELPPETVEQMLGFRLKKVEQDLAAPDRYARMRTELTDRLGLIHQEMGAWEKAADQFEQAFAWHKRAGLTQNLARNKRAAAYCEYMRAQDLQGIERREMLLKAAAHFQEALELAEQYGVVPPQEKERAGLIQVEVELALDQTKASEASRGFTADQEKRLAETFISRIHLELGRLKSARENLQHQLALYPPGKPLAEKDVYGVALLHHRAGLLGAAETDYSAAFDAFESSAKLCEQMNNPVSSAINVTNMGWVLTRLGPPASEKAERIRRLAVRDRAAVNLLADIAAVGGSAFPADYHNAMGGCYLRLAQTDPGPLENAAQKMGLLQRAAMHFQAGITGLAADTWQNDRHAGNLLAVLHLNMAAAAGELGEAEACAQHLTEARVIAEQALLPDLEWRALARLGHLTEALGVLEKITILRAHCEPFELLGLFAPLVPDLINQGRTEAAFNLTEQLAEHERFQRTAFLLGSFDRAQKELFSDIQPRLMRIRQLRRDVAAAPKAELAALAQALEQEQKLLTGQIGKGGGKLPEALGRLPEGDQRETALLLLGLAAQAESTADEYVRATDKDGAQPLLLKYRRLLDDYRTLRQEAAAKRPENQGADILTLLGPEPLEAMDVMAQIPRQAKLIRWFAGSPEGGWASGPTKNGVVAFELTSADIRALVHPDMTAARGAALAEAQKSALTVAFENPGLLPENLAGALSAAHFMRSRANRKPFKRSLLALPPPLNLPKDFETVSPLPDSGDPTAWPFPQTADAHTLLILDPIRQSIKVPTRSGERGELELSLRTDDAVIRPFQQLLPSAERFSLALLPGAGAEDRYILGHLLSIHGCPTMLTPQQKGDHGEFLDSFLQAYPGASALAAKTRAAEILQSKAGSGPEWSLLGDGGMGPEEAAVFIEGYLTQAIQKGRKAFEAGRWDEALGFFQNAVWIAVENPKFKPHWAALYKYGRESAFRAKNMEKARLFAQKLADLVAAEQPDTKEHGEALLRLGLIAAAMEQNEAAVPLLQEAVEIFSNLELPGEQAAALSDLGVVLENATDYDRAFSAFQDAAELSRKTNKADLLAAQYRNIGRLNDLRLSRYPSALEAYQKALDIYERGGEAATANVVQALLDMGRCYRLLGNFKEADRHYAEALSGADKIPARMDLKAKVLIEQANNAWFQARYEEAFKLQRKAQALAQENRLAQVEIMAANTAGLIWWTLGDHQKAMDILEATLTMAREKVKRPDEIASTLNNIGLIHRDRQHYDEALRVFDEALTIDTKLKSRWAMAYDHRNKALTLLQMGRPAEALPLFETAVQESHAIGNRINETKALFGLGQTQATLGRLAEARETMQQALEMARAMSIREIEWRCLFELAKLCLPQDRLAAETHLRAAVDVIEGMRAEIRIDQLKEAFIDNKLSVYETLVEILVDQGKAEAAFEVAERSRARSFIDLLGNQRLSLKRAVDQAAYDRHRQIRLRMEETEQLLAQSRRPEEKAAYQQQLSALKLEFQNVLLDIQAENPELANFISVVPLQAEAFSQSMEADTAFLSYYILPKEILCWVVGAKNQDAPIRLIRTPMDRAAFGQSILEYRRLLQNLEPLEDQSRRLFALLLEKARPHLQGVKYLGIIPHGPVHYLSFATLWNGEKYLIDDFSLFYLPSAGVWQYTRGRRTTQKNLKVLAIGNPDLGDPALALPFAEHEVAAIRWNFPDITVLTQERATEEWVKHNIASFGVIHLASHGEFDPVNPLFSAVKLTKGGEGDGNLEAVEVFGLTINADMVVLSACQTGLGKITQGDDVIGLNRAFFYAGTHTVVASLWRVSDVSTAVLIKSFYRNYVTENKADSLRQGILHVKNRYQHPGYWGAFALVGDFR